MKLSAPLGKKTAGKQTLDKKTLRAERGGCRCCLLLAMVLLVPALAGAEPIAGTTYTYDLSTEDMTPGGFTVFATPHAFADDTDDSTDLSVITTNGLLNDGNLGDDTTKVPFGAQDVLFANGTYAGFQNSVGTGLSPQPRVNIDLGGAFDLTSFTLHYLVEDSASIYSPRPVPDDCDSPRLMDTGRG